MLQEILVKLFERDLDKLRDEVEAYVDEADLWKVNGAVTNSGGNLALHLVGNLNHFIGGILGNSGYVRDRDAEFTDKDLSRQKLLDEIDRSKPFILAALGTVTDEVLASNYPIEVFGHPMTTEFFLVHLSTHFNYHLGQLNYHRRMAA